MIRPTRRQAQLLGASTAILLAVGVLAAVFGPYPKFLLHRVLPFESGPAGAIGQRYEVDDTDFGGSEILCIEETPVKRCDYFVQLRAPAPRQTATAKNRDNLSVDEPMLLLLRIHHGPLHPLVYYPEVVDAVAVPPELARAKLLSTDRRDVIALGREPDADGWYPALAAWRVDIDHWRLSAVSAKGLEGADPDESPTGRLPLRPELYAAIAWRDFSEPADIKRPTFDSFSTDDTEDGYTVTHLYDLTEELDVIVVFSHREFVHTHIETLPHEADLTLVHGLMADGALRGDLIGLLNLDERELPVSVNRAWRLTTQGTLVPVPLEGITCRLNPASLSFPNGPYCERSRDNRRALDELETQAT